jgi:hypothetical protein
MKIWKRKLKLKQEPLTLVQIILTF